MKQKWSIELLFWIATLILAFILVHPIYQYYDLKFPFIFSNVVMVVLFITLSRYLFLLQYTPFSHNSWVKLFILFLCIPLMLYCVDRFWTFQRFLDEGMLESIATVGDTLQQIDDISNYTRYEFIFFATSSIITLALTPIRMMVSIWRGKNKGTV